MVDFNCFVDEVEMQRTENTALTFFFFGVIISTEQYIIEEEIKTILLPLDGNKFHAHKTYRDPLFTQICDKITNIIIDFDIKVVCFPFVRNWLDSPSLVILKKFKLNELQKVTPENYRSQAWLLFIHVLNQYLYEKHPLTSTQLIFDRDWMSEHDMVKHGGEKLQMITDIYFSTQLKMPLLSLCDHIGYLFQKFKKIAFNENGIWKYRQPREDDIVSKCSIRLFKHLTANNKFKNLDLAEWIDKERIQY